MAAVSPPICEFGLKAPDFDLEGVDGRRYTLADVRGANGTLIVFMCNHCPYVKSVIDRIVADAKALEAEGIGTVAIMPNDTDAYPADSFDNMKRFAEAHAFTFPYVIDRTQAVARAYDAICTPDFFGFDADLGLQYRGRLDESKLAPVAGARRELLEAMIAIARTGKGPDEQIASMGCSIKWRVAA
jgi:peroxiredoxin